MKLVKSSGVNNAEESALALGCPKKNEENLSGGVLMNTCGRAP